MHKDCTFCQIIAKQRFAHIVFENDETIAFLDHRPIAIGHLQLAPKVHYRWIYDIPHMGSFFTTAQLIIRGIIPELNADHVTMGTFGHEIHHAHLWIVPQYQRDRHISEGKGNRTDPSQLEITALKLRGALMKEV